MITMPALYGVPEPFGRYGIETTPAEHLQATVMMRAPHHITPKN